MAKNFSSVDCRVLSLVPSSIYASAHCCETGQFAESEANAQDFSIQCLRSRCCESESQNRMASVHPLVFALLKRTYQTGRPVPLQVCKMIQILHIDKDTIARKMTQRTYNHAVALLRPAP